MGAYYLPIDQTFSRTFGLAVRTAHEPTTVTSAIRGEVQAVDPADVNATAMDPKSIMIYPIPAAWTLDGFSAGFNSDLSEKDKKFIRKQYT